MDEAVLHEIINEHLNGDFKFCEVDKSETDGFTADILCNLKTLNNINDFVTKYSSDTNETLKVKYSKNKKTIFKNYFHVLMNRDVEKMILLLSR